MPRRRTVGVSGLSGLGLLAALALAAPAVWAQAPGSGAAPAERPSLLPPGEAGTPLHVEGRIVGLNGSGGAALYVYQTDARGYYSGEVNDDNRNPRLKARFTTRPDGTFAFRTIMPGPYPRSGPPAHIHLEVTPPGKPMEQFELVFEGDPRLTDAIRADAKAGKFYTICAPATGAGGIKQCRGATFRVH